MSVPDVPVPVLPAAGEPPVAPPPPIVTVTAHPGMGLAGPATKPPAPPPPPDPVAPPPPPAITKMSAVLTPQADDGAD